MQFLLISCKCFCSHIHVEVVSACLILLHLSSTFLPETWVHQFQCFLIFYMFLREFSIICNFRRYYMSFLLSDFPGRAPLVNISCIIVILCIFFWILFNICNFIDFIWNPLFTQSCRGCVYVSHLLHTTITLISPSIQFFWHDF